MTTARSMRNELRSLWRDATTVERVAFVTGIALLLSGVIHGVILVASGASWEGPRSLRKAATFGLSFGLTLLTIVWVAIFLPLGKRARVVWLGLFTAASAVETTLVTLQAWRGVPSHFNFETPFDAFVARTLAAGGAILIIVIAALTISAFRLGQEVPARLRIAIRIGFVTLDGALLTGAAMIARGVALVFRGNRSAAYATGGQLKPTHAVLMHGVLLLPALAWSLSFVDWSERRKQAVMISGLIIYLAIVGFVVVANLGELG